MSLRNKRIAILNDSTKYGRLTIMQQPIVHTYSLGELYTERKEKGDPSLPILTVSIHAGVSEGELDEDKLGKKVKRITDKTQYKTARKGDLVFNMMRAWQGAIGVVRSDGLVSPAYIVAKPNEKIWPEYMDYCMKTPRMIHAIHRQSYGVTDFRLRLYWDSFTHITCQLPPLPEQQKIAAILSTQDKVIELKEKLLVQKQQQKKYLMQQLLTGKKRLPGFGGEWKTIHLNEISCRIETKNTVGNSNVLTISAQYGLINQTEFFDKVIASNDKSNYYLLSKDEFAYNRSYSKGYPYGTIKRLKRYVQGVVSPLYICFAVNKKLASLDFLEQYFDASIINREIQSIVQEGARNHGMLNVAVDDFFRIKITMPEIEEQKEIAKILSTADHEIDLLQKSIEAEKQKKKALMQLLLTGKVRVKI